MRSNKGRWTRGKRKSRPVAVGSRAVRQKLPKVMMPVEEEEGPPLTDPRARDPRILRERRWKSMGMRAPSMGTSRRSQWSRGARGSRSKRMASKSKLCNHVRFRGREKCGVCVQ